MADDLALRIPILADTSKFKQSLSEMHTNVKASLEPVKEALGAVGIAAAGYLKGAVSSAAAAEKTNANLAQTIKSTGDACGMTAKQISNMAVSQSKVTTFSAGMIKTGDAMLATFTNIGKNVFPQASQAMLDLSQKMGTQPQQAAIQLGKALNDPVKGITALQRVGVTFTAQQKDVIKQLVATGNTAGAQKIILAELNKEFGGQAAAAANTYDGQMKQMQNTMNSVKATIGSALLPYLLKFGQELNGVVNVIANFVNNNKKLVAGVLAGTAAFGTFIGGASIVQKTLSILGPVAEGLGTTLAGLAAPVAGVIAGIGLLTAAYKTNFGGFKTLVDGFVGNVKNGFGAASTEFKKSGDVAKAVGAGFTQAFGPQAGKVITTALSAIQSTFNGLASVVKQHIPEMKALASDLGNMLKRIWDSILKPVFQILQTTIMMVVNIVKQHIPEIKAVFSACFTGIQALWNSVLKPVLNFVISQVGQVINFIKQSLGPLKEIISTIINSIVGDTKNKVNIITSLWKTFGGTISAEVKTAFNIIKTVISSALKIVEDVITIALNVVTGHWGKAWSALKDIFKTAFTGVLSVIGDLLKLLARPFIDIAKTAISWGKNIIHGAISGIKSVGTGLYDIGKNIVHGLANGISGAINTVKNAAHKLASAVGDKIKGFFGIHSPSKLTTEYGGHIGQGLANGIAGKKSEAVKATTTLTDSVKNTMKSNQKAIQDAMNYKVDAPKIDYTKSNEETKKQITARKKAQKEALAAHKKAVAEHKKLIAEHNKAINDVAKNIKNTYTTTLTTLQGQINKALNTGKTYTAQIDNTKKAMELVKKEINLTTAEYDKMVKIKGKNSTESNALLSKINSENNQYNKLSKGLTTLIDKHTALVKKQNETAQNKAVKQIESSYTTSLNNIDNVIKKLSISTKDNNKDLINTQKAMQDTHQKADILRAEYEEIVKVKGKNSAEAQKLIKAIGDEGTAYDKLKQKATDLTAKIKEEAEKRKQAQIDSINKLNDKIVAALQKRYEKQEKDEEDSLQHSLDDLEKWKNESLDKISKVYDAKNKQLDNDTKNQTDALQAQIDAIDTQQQADEDAKNNKEELDNIASLNSQLLAETDADKKADIQKQLDDANQDRADRLHKKEIDDQKANLQKQIETLKDNADKQKDIWKDEEDKKEQLVNDTYNSVKDSLDRELQDTKDFYAKKLDQANLNAESEKMIMSNSQNDIINLLNDFGTQYEDAGTTLGEKLVSGIKPKIQSIKGMLADLTNTLNSAAGSTTQTSSNVSLEPTSNITDPDDQPTANSNYNMKNSSADDAIMRAKKAYMDAQVRNDKAGMEVAEKAAADARNSGAHIGNVSWDEALRKYKQLYGVDWHKDGGIFTKPTLLPGLSGMHGVGEAGAEAILPLSKLFEGIKESLAIALKSFKIPAISLKIDTSALNNLNNSLLYNPAISSSAGFTLSNGQIKQLGITIADSISKNICIQPGTAIVNFEGKQFAKATIPYLNNELAIAAMRRR